MSDDTTTKYICDNCLKEFPSEEDIQFTPEGNYCQSNEDEDLDVCEDCAKSMSYTN